MVAVAAAVTSATPAASPSSSSSVFTPTTYPLTTIFTPPAQCTHSWTYEREFYNSVTGGLLLQNAVPSWMDEDCFPTGFIDNGRAPGSQFYSPGICPEGYVTQEVRVDVAAHTAVCCQSDFSLTSTVTTVNHGGEPRLFVGCIGSYPAGSSTVVRYRFGLFELTTSTVTGPITMWGQPISVAYKEADISLFPKGALSVASSTGVQPSTITAPPRTTSQSPSISTPAASGNPTALPTNDDSNRGIGSSTLAAIVVATVLGTALVACLLWLFCRRRKKTRLNHQPTSTQMKSSETIGFPYNTNGPYVAELNSECVMGEMSHEAEKRELEAPVRPVELQGEFDSKPNRRTNPGPYELG